MKGATGFGQKKTSTPAADVEVIIPSNVPGSSGELHHLMF
jgi:hypothetical protein